MTKKDFEDFDLEDIIREFGNQAETEEESDKDIAAFADQQEEIVQPEQTQVLPDLSEIVFAVDQTQMPPTSMMEDIEIPEEETAEAEDFSIPDELFDPNALKQDLEADTIRLDDALPHGKTATVPEETAPVAEEEPQEEMDYTKSWTPEYQQEQAVIEPIVFRPHSRLKELKKQLVSGPEHRYYEMLEKGTGKLVAAFFACLAIVLLSAAATALHAFGLVPADRMRLLIFGQILAMMLCALLGSFQLIKGAADLIRGRFSLNSLLGITFLFCCADAFFCLQDLRVPCCAAFGLEVAMSLWATYHRRTAKMSQLDTMRKATILDALGVSRNEEGNDVVLRGEGQVEDFMNTCDEKCPCDKIQSIYALCALGLSLAIGITAGILHGLSAASQVIAVSLLAAVPAASFICTTRPWAILQRRLHKLGSVICGWTGIRALTGKVIFPLHFEDLFPAGTIKMNGVKYFGSCQPEHIAAYAASVASATESGLAPLFDQLLEKHNASHYAVQELTVYDRGYACKIAGNTVLWGRASFLKDMEVPMEEGLHIANSICIAVNGELSGLFAITYDKNKAAAGSLNTLCSYRGLSPAMAASDPTLSAGFLKNKFGVNPKRMLFPDHDTRSALRHLEMDEIIPVSVLTTQAGLAPLAYGVTGARAVWTSTRVGLLIQMIGGAIGLGAMLTLTILGALYLLTPASMFLYQLIWLLPGLLITEWTRSI